MSLALVDKLVDDAKLLADFVVIDSAPLTAVIDALPFAQAADEVLIVARLDETRLNKLRELIDLLSQNGVASSGLVVIGAQPTRSGYDYPATGANGAPGSGSGRVKPEREPSRRGAPGD